MESSALDIIKIDSKNSLYTGKSKVKDAGEGLFSKKHVTQGTPITIYYGEKVTNEEMYDLFTNNPEKYHQLNNSIRGTPNGYAICGIKNMDNMNLNGVYVNDIASITCKKEEINEQVLRAYAETRKKCNVRAVDTSDYPVYIASRRIKKGDEIYAHYGIGYWLSHIGCAPNEITDLNRKYDFSSFYL